MPTYDGLLPPLATLVAFEAAFRHRNFSRAATELFQSQATVSRRVRELEEDLGVCLFERHRHNVTPTAVAEELVVSVRLSLSELSLTADRIRRRAGRDDAITVLTSMSLASAMVAPIIDRFQQEHPEVKLRVVSRCEPIQSTGEPFDIAIQYGPSDAPGYEVDFIVGETIFPVCSPAFAERLPTPLAASDLPGLPLLHVEYEDPSWATWADLVEIGKTEPREAEAGMVLTSYEMCLDMAARGRGLALGWERSVTPRIAAGQLVRVPGLVLPQAVSINAYRPRRASNSNHVTDFLTMLRAAVAADAPAES